MKLLGTSAHLTGRRRPINVDVTFPLTTFGAECDLFFIFQSSSMCFQDRMFPEKLSMIFAVKMPSWSFKK